MSCLVVEVDKVESGSVDEVFTCTSVLKLFLSCILFWNLLYIMVFGYDPNFALDPSCGIRIA